MKSTCIYVKAPFQFEKREIELRNPDVDEAIIKVMACGVCGTDLLVSRSQAVEFSPFGHEVSGVIEKLGSNVKAFKEGDKVMLESGSFCRECATCRNGRVDLCNDAPNMFIEPVMGYSDYMVVSKECLVPLPDAIPFDEATLIEPLGVALDLFYAGEICLNDEVLVIGLGPIGLMALRLAKLTGVRKLYAADRNRNVKRKELAEYFGADEFIGTDDVRLSDYNFERMPNKILITAPTSVIPEAISLVGRGGTVAFIGLGYDERMITFDADHFHFNKTKLHASHAAPALYFPRCMDLIMTGKVDVKALITNHFKLEETGEAIKYLNENKSSVVKSVMVNY
jgi:threonine dehydrogenase-like Zn-dependent dehydrogenase